MRTHENDLDFKVIKRKGRLFLDYEGWTYDLSPPEIVRMALPPNILGVDFFLMKGAMIKGIEGDFRLKFDLEESLQYDTFASYIGKLMNGWIYEMAFGHEQRKVWVCEYMKLIFKEPPKKSYITIRPLGHN